MPYILSEKIRVGVSACNAGARVRWNRAGWDRLKSLDRELSNFIWTPVCPETMAGLGTHRCPTLSGHRCVPRPWRASGSPVIRSA
jgi:uncharacterized protein YbbK (DUF523 family)